MCIQTGQITCTYDDGCFLFVNTGQEIVDSENGLLTTLAFQLGPNEKPVYALEGAFANAGFALRWLRSNLSVNCEMNQYLNSTMVHSVCTGNTDTSTVSSLNSNCSNYNTTIDTDTTEVVFVPAFSGLYSPYWKHNARG